MSAPRSDGSSVRYYCTAGNGMETFLIDEVKRKLAAEDVCQVPGKVLFSSSAGINRVTELKAAERLFLLLKQDSPVRLSTHTSSAKAASVLQSRLLGDGNHWTSAVMTWSRLQGELADRKTTAVNTTSAALAMTREGEEGKEQREEEEKGHAEWRESTGEQSEAESGEQNGAGTLEKKRKREEEVNGCEGGRDGERERKEDTSEETCAKARTLEKKRRRDDGEEKELSEREGEIVENVETTGGRDKTLVQPSWIKPEPSSVPVSFRICCKCTGSLSRYFSTQDVSRVIGVGLSRLLGWKTELKNPQLEVNVCLSDDVCLLGIPLTRLPLACRSYMKSTGLRSTVAWAMASLAQIQPGFCVVDPMCGTGTILIEAAQEHKTACFLGMDIDDGQLQKADQNVEFAQLGNRIHLLKASSMVLPLPSASVDAVVCDLPFGRKFGTKSNMAASLPLILTEMERVLCIGGTLVLLLSPQLSCLLKKLLAQKDTGPMSKQETKPPTGIQDCESPSLSSTKHKTCQLHQGVESSSPTQGPDPRPGLQHPLSPPFSSLRHKATFRVSLGVIDGLIHKYVKIDT